MSDQNIKLFINKVMTGEEFCTYFPNLSQNLIKLVRGPGYHNGIKIKEGENKDPRKFNEKFLTEYNDYVSAGLHFTDMDNLPLWLSFGIKGCAMYYMKVDLPFDCMVCIKSENNFSADKIILGNKKLIKDLDSWKDKDYCIDAMKKSGFALRYMEKPIPEDIQLAAVNKFGINIRHLIDIGEDISEKVQMAAVRQDGDSISYIVWDDNLSAQISDEVKLAAINQHPRSIVYLTTNNIYIPEEVQLLAVEKDPNVVEFLLQAKINISEKVQLAVVERRPDLIKDLLKSDIYVFEKVRSVADNLLKCIS